MLLCTDGATTKAVDVKLARSSIYLTADDSDPLPADQAASSPTGASSTPPAQADEATTKLLSLKLSVPYGQKAVHGEYSPADKRWGLTRQSYEGCAEFGKLYRGTRIFWSVRAARPPRT